jgi:hypothetical protein
VGNAAIPLPKATVSAYHTYNVHKSWPAAVPHNLNQPPVVPRGSRMIRSAHGIVRRSVSGFVTHAAWRLNPTAWQIHSQTEFVGFPSKLLKVALRAGTVPLLSILDYPYDRHNTESHKSGHTELAICFPAETQGRTPPRAREDFAFEPDFDFDCRGSWNP